MNARHLIATLVLTCGAVRAAEPEAPRFSRHVVPVLSKLGCNGGGCHGSVNGKAGFKLSLFGAKPLDDHRQIALELAGRRLDPAQPHRSLLLRKAAGQLPHEGGMRTDADSPEYAILLNWIRAGAAVDRSEDSIVNKLEISPARQTLALGAAGRLQATAHFADGSTMDVTALCTFESADKYTVEADAEGAVKAVAVGDTAIVVRYRSLPAVASVVVPGKPIEPAAPLENAGVVDRHVRAKLARMNIRPAPLCDDPTFLRRLHFDVVGAPPTPDEVRAFLADTDPQKRSKLIDALLGRPGHASLWATKFCDILRPGEFDAKSGLVEAAETRRFHEWIRARLAENVPYDQLAQRILTATGREGASAQDWVMQVRALCEENSAGSHDLKEYAKRKTLDLYWLRADATGVDGAMKVAHAFLGLRLECARCHRHPHDVWQQDDVLAFANFFTRVSGAGGKASAEVAKAGEGLEAEAKKNKEQIKALDTKAKDKSLAKPEADALKAESKKLSERNKAIDAAAKRLKAAEVHVLASAKAATVSSPLGTQTSPDHRLLGKAGAVTPAPGSDPRTLVVEWMRSRDNPFFARALVNRVWAHYFGRGIVDPPDHLSPLNPPSHPELLAELCDDFVTSKFDLKHLHRTLLNSRAYQSAASTGGSDRASVNNFAVFAVRRVSAEILVDALNQAVAGRETLPTGLFLPPDAKAIEIAGSVNNGKENSKEGASLEYALRIFGRPPRRTDMQCDCERVGSPAVTQTLYLANHPQVIAKLAATQSRVAMIVKAIDDDGKRIDEVYLWTLCRLPDEAERNRCLAYLKDSASPTEGLTDIQWSLLNTREFLLQH